MVTAHERSRIAAGDGESFGLGLKPAFCMGPAWVLATLLERARLAASLTKFTKSLVASFLTLLNPVPKKLLKVWVTTRCCIKCAI